MHADHRFGIEIEFNTNASARRVVDALNASGLTADQTDRCENEPGIWGVKSDGSIGTGWEIVSPILTAAELTGEVRKVGAALHRLKREFGNTVRAGVACGLHIHLSGWGENNVAALRNLAMRFMYFEDTFDYMQPESRRANHNTFCRSNIAQFGGWGVTMLDRYNAMRDTLSACHSQDSLVYRVSPERYRKLNLQSLQRHGTVEFRHHSGTVDAEKIIHWATFLSSFAQVSAEAQRVWRRKDPATADVQPERFRKLMRGVPIATVAYLFNRVRRLNGGRFPGAPVVEPPTAISSNLLNPSGLLTPSVSAERPVGEVVGRYCSLDFALEQAALHPGSVINREEGNGHYLVIDARLGQTDNLVTA